MTPHREHDLVLFGATGFTGALTAEYLARHAPSDFRWALAGRNGAKLRALRTRLAELNPACAELPLLHGDVSDPGSLHQVAASTRVVITTVGPYIHYGEPLVAACASTGTDYVDLTGEPEFVDLMYLRHHERAVRSGARIVHACGFDSIPYDLGVHFTVSKLPQDVPVHVDGYVRAGATVSGGTLQSAVTAFSRPRNMRATAKQRRDTDPRPRDRSVRTPPGVPHRAGGKWALPMPSLDPQVVGRSAAALDSYGPEFSYRQYAAINRLPVAVGSTVGLGALLALAQVPPARRWLLDRRKSGDGPTPEQRARAWFQVRFLAEGGGRRVITEVSGGDPGYTETAKMLSESALCLALDRPAGPGGQLTTATVMGSALTDRLVAAGLKFRLISSS